MPLCASRKQYTRAGYNLLQLSVSADNSIQSLFLIPFLDDFKSLVDAALARGPVFPEALICAASAIARALPSDVPYPVKRKQVGDEHTYIAA